LYTTGHSSDELCENETAATSNKQRTLRSTRRAARKLQADGERLGFQQFLFYLLDFHGQRRCTGIIHEYKGALVVFVRSLSRSAEGSFEDDNDEKMR
jgi:hypothetical protein